MSSYGSFGGGRGRDRSRSRGRGGRGDSRGRGGSRGGYGGGSFGGDRFGESSGVTKAIQLVFNGNKLPKEENTHKIKFKTRIYLTKTRIYQASALKNIHYVNRILIIFRTPERQRVWQRLGEHG